MQHFIYKATPSLQIAKEDKEFINTTPSVLIQLFSGENQEKIQILLDTLSKEFPHAIIITASTDGEIFHREVLQYTSLVSISTFDATQLKIAYTQESNSFQAGKELAQQLCTERTKLLISFTNGINCNGEEFLEGIYAANPKVTVSGGLAGDNAKFEKCLIGINNQLHDSGAVAVALDSDVLCVQSLYSFGWQAIGLKHIISKSYKNRVYTIDNMSISEFYKKYLGEAATKSLPMTGIEFPLIIQKDGVELARAIVSKHDDGSFSFTGNLEEGTEVYIGIGEKQSILADHIKNNNSSINVEAFFIYSCMARRRFIPDLVHQELEPFAALAPTAGFFTYGEFFTSKAGKKPLLLNQTLTAVALSEVQKCDLQIISHTIGSKNNSTIQALMHLLEVTSKELQEQTQEQKRIHQELNTKTKTLERIQEMSGLGSWELDLKTMKISWSYGSYKIYNIDPSLQAPNYDEFLEMVLPEDREKLKEVQKALEDGEIHSTEIRVKRNDGKVITVVESGKVLYDEMNQAIKIVGTTLDITDIRLKDTMLMQQAHSAQMGEMINMIAHQWRQPLNAISSAAIKLNLQNSMGILSEEEITQTSQFIEKMTQKMSQTINDFMDFAKPTKQKEYIKFDEILEEILAIIGPQLHNRDIILTTKIETNVELYTYKKELEHILINILSNARDALEEQSVIEKRIHLHIYLKNALCIIKIQDNAGGIDEAIIERIFDPYFSTKETHKGTGLGLYMSKKILQEHLNGDIFVRNNEDGAEFTILLDRTNENNK